MSITTENESSELVFKDTSLFGMFFFSLYGGMER